MSIGTIIGGKYRIEKEIKRGGFGIIYEGIDETFGKAVAIKAIAPHLVDEAKYIDMFQQEAVNVAQLNHQNIVQILDINRDDNGIYIIMELIQGFDLITLLKACRKSAKPLPTLLGAYIIAEVCNGLHYAHNRRNGDMEESLNLVHQDISPVNIMVTHTGEVKIIDFGMSRLKRQDSQKRGEVQIQGNIRYLAPEQIKRTGKIDCRTDVFAAGIILFELLTGERLIPSTDKQKIIENTLMGEYDLSRLERDEIPNQLRQIIKKALQRNPANRYPTANHIYRDLMHYIILTAPAADFMNDLSEFIAEMQPELLAVVANETSDEPETESPQIATPEAQSVNDEQPPVFEINDHASYSEPKENQNDDDNKEPEPAAEDKEPEFTDETTTVSESEPDSSSDYYSFVENTDDDDQKTIIDVVRLSARTHKKAIMVTAYTLILSCISFMAVDTFAQFTPVGASIYDYFFPPAIKIVSIPSGAMVYLDDNLLDQTTPLALEKITPGVHKLMLKMPQYQSIIKSISVPSKGMLHLSGAKSQQTGRPYVLHFKSQFEFLSQPAGANIIIDGVKMKQQTPATIFWEVGDEPTNVEMEIPNLPKLAGLSINTIDDEEYISDKRVWKLDKPLTGKAHYIIEGIFHKNIIINSKPRLADIYMDGNEKPVGITGVNGNLMLKIGQHSFTLKKAGFLTSSFTVDIDENTPFVINKNLSRRVRIFAKDAASGVDQDLGAKLIELQLNNKRIPFNKHTPLMATLLPYAYTAKLVKKGYHDLEIEIPSNARSVIAKMEPLFFEVTVKAIDAITSSPINAAKISCRSKGSVTDEAVLGITNLSGTIVSKLLPGTYEIYISKSGYQTQRKTIGLEHGKDNRLTFRLTASR